MHKFKNSCIFVDLKKKRFKFAIPFFKNKEIALLISDFLLYINELVMIYDKFYFRRAYHWMAMLVGVKLEVAKTHRYFIGIVNLLFKKVKNEVGGSMGWYTTTIHRRDPTTARHGVFCLLRFRPGPNRPSLVNLVSWSSL